MITDLNWSLIIAVMFFLVSACYLFLVVATYMFDTRTKTQRDYLLTGLILMTSSFFYGVMIVSGSDTFVRIYWTIGFLAFCMFCPVWLMFLSNLVKFKSNIMKFLYRNGMILSFVLGLLCITSSDIRFINTAFGNQFSFYNSTVFIVLLAYTTIMSGILIAVHFIWLRQSIITRYRKLVLSIIIFTVATTPVVYVTDFFIPIFTETTVIPLGSAALMPVSLFVFYSMRKYKLFGITVSNVSEYTFTSVTIPIYVLDNNNNICLENVAAVECLGASAIGKNIADFVILKDNVSDVSLFTRSFVNKTVFVDTTSGTRIFDMALTVENDKFNDAICKIAVLKDITEINEALNQINDQNIKLSKLNDMAILFLSQTDASFEDKMTAGIDLLAEEVVFNRLSVWRNFTRAGELYTSQIYCWNRDAGGTVPPRPEFVEVLLSKISSDWEGILSGEVVVNGPIRSISDPVTSNILYRYGASSAFISPISLGDDRWGFALFEDDHTEKVFDVRAVETMRSAAYLSANVVMRREMERKLEFAFHEATEANKAKSEFLAKMSHEIRTPMNAIIGMSELVLREKTSDSVRENASIIKQAGANLLSIINDILDFSKIETGKLQIQPVSYSLSSLINDVKNIIQIRVADLNVEFIVNIDNDIPDALIGDVVRIRQALINILGNAVKHTISGHISLSVKGEFVDDGDNIDLTMIMEDTGSGIRQEDLADIFAEYYQVTTDSTDGADGVGLGLAITWGIVTAMKGEISVDSEYGKGTVFTIRLPQKVGDPDKMASVDHKSEIVSENVVSFTAPGAKVLVADDISTNLRVVYGLLTPYEMHVDLRISGAEAIEAIKANRYDLVFMDHLMPGMDGVETTERIRALGDDDPYFTDLPIVALTANAVTGMREMFLQSGFNDFMSKPIDTVVLNSVLKKWIPADKQLFPEE